MSDFLEFRYVRKGLKSFTEIDIPTESQNLYFQGNFLTDFLGICSSESCVNIVLDENPIITFYGVSKLPNLQTISLINTPISKLKNFRILTLLAFGLQLDSINGTKVSPEERSAALAYGDPENSFLFMQRGWLPTKPTNFVKRTIPKPTFSTPTKEFYGSLGVKKMSRSNTETVGSRTREKKGKFMTPSKPKYTKTDEIHSEITRINDVLRSQENDPISVRAVRLLRATGETKEEMKDFLRNYFSRECDSFAEVKPKARVKRRTKYDEQLEKQDEIINVLSVQINQIRNEGASFANYNKMLLTVGAPLLKNADILNGEVEEEKTKRKIQSSDDFQKLRSVIVKCVDADPLIENSDLIELFNEKLNHLNE